MRETTGSLVTRAGIGTALCILSFGGNSSLLAQEVYKSVDKDGHVTYTNAPTQAGAQLQHGLAAVSTPPPIGSHVQGGVLGVADHDPNARDARGDTPLHQAVFFDNEELTRSLIARGANVKATNVYGDTPLHVAAGFNRPKVARILIAAGARLDAENLEGQTPLHTAVGARAVDMVTLLLDNRASVNATDLHNRTPLDMVFNDKTSPVAALLRRHGGFRASSHSMDETAPLPSTGYSAPPPPPAGAEHVTRYEYDDRGNRTSVTRDGATTTYEYNADNQLLRSSGPAVGSGHSQVTTYEYDDHGNQRRVTRDGTATSYDYNGYDQLQRVVPGR
jgi:hypothetical protein